MTNPAKKPRKMLKKSDPTYEMASKQLKDKITELYGEFGSDPMNKKICKDLKKHVEKYIEAIAPYNPGLYTLIEAQWIKLCDDYEIFLKNPKNPEFSKYVSDSFLVFKTEIDNIAA